jgi:pyrimidine nucleoside transport protein
MPLAYLMGVDWKDAGMVGELIGMKTFLNEFLAYKELSGYMKNRIDCSGPYLSVSIALDHIYLLGQKKMIVGFP